MKPYLLLPAAESFTDSIDYTQGLITRQYLQNGAKYYFTLHLEHYVEDEAMVPTGRYMVAILSPKGLRSFYVLRNGEGKYVMDSEEGEEPDNTGSVVNEAGELEPIMNLGGYDLPFSEEMRRQLAELNNMDEYLPLINQAIKEHSGLT